MNQQTNKSTTGTSTDLIIYYGTIHKIDFN